MIASFEYSMTERRGKFKDSITYEILHRSGRNIHKSDEEMFYEEFDTCVKRGE